MWNIIGDIINTIIVWKHLDLFVSGSDMIYSAYPYLCMKYYGEELLHIGRYIFNLPYGLKQYTSR